MENSDIRLEEWATTNFETFGLVGEFSQDTVGGIDIVKTQENVHLMSTFIYFFQKGSKMYAINEGSEEYIAAIIENGNW